VDLGPALTDRYDARTVWWRHERLHRTALRAPERLLPRFVAERDAVEQHWLADPPDPSAAFAAADELTAAWLGRVTDVVVADVRPPYVRRYWRVRDARAELRAPGQPAA
jgi:secernin